MAVLPSIQPPGRTPLNKVKTLQDLFEHPDFRKRIAEALPAHINPDRMMTTFRIAVQKVPKLRQCNPLSLLGSFVTLGYLGLEPNTPLGHAYLIPFEVTKYDRETRQKTLIRTDVQLILGYQGLLDLCMRGDRITSIQSNNVWAGDDFSYEFGSNQHLRHVPGRDPSLRGDQPELAYLHTRLKGGAEQFEVMSRADVEAIRDKSQAYKSALNARMMAARYGRNPDEERGWIDAPWVGHFPAMMRKTVIRQGTKYLPRNPELAMAEALDDATDRGRPQFDRVDSKEAFLDGEWMDGGVSADEEPDHDEDGVIVDQSAGGKEEEKPATRRTRTTKVTTTVDASLTDKPADKPADSTPPPPPDDNGDPGYQGDGRPVTPPLSDALKMQADRGIDDELQF
ncbi:RecT Recombinational DNA repair protein (RecE pathway) [uncultured Caudovirales phage]|uniref:RecT Recombinational DNA repair protein (RecE pathway) n=1 Tax=uncultured Caudovirales phage TaxID=2100421 RepID=A0A6J5MH05_9CAUD|nr:RecT Recombinational DNA repair protein (RecE pathway) [uncultured Caudovirales phage]CAB4189773.1 RecT Recombinational DNA repair protein (RecE pathway) [uncultured Caudovirales phage]